MTKQQFTSLILSAGGVASFFVIAALTNQRSGIVNNFAYQLGVLVVTLLIIVGYKSLFKAKFLRKGDLAAKASPVKLLGIKASDNWRNTGISFAVIISVVTGIVLYIGNQQVVQSVSLQTILLALAIAVPLAVINAFNEEIITRWVIVEGFADKRNLAPLLSALIFGIPHYFGVPGGIGGVILAGVMGWILAKSVQDTHGMGWAVFIHFLQDVMIFAFLLIPLL